MSIKWRHFNDLERPLTHIAVAPLFDAEHLRNGTRYTHSYNEILTGTYTCPTQVCHFKRSRVNSRVTSSEFAKYSTTRTKHRAVSLQQLSFLFRLSTCGLKCIIQPSVTYTVFVTDGCMGRVITGVGQQRSISFLHSSALETYRPPYASASTESLRL